jgi:hypothetical protein
MYSDAEKLFPSRLDKAIGAGLSAAGVCCFAWLGEHASILSRWLYLGVGVPGCLLFLVLSMRYLLWRHPTVIIGPTTLTLALPSFVFQSAPPIVIPWSTIVSIRAIRVSRYLRVVRLDLRQDCHQRQSNCKTPEAVSIPDYAVGVSMDILAGKLQRFAQKAAR